MSASEAGPRHDLRSGNDLSVLSNVYCTVLAFYQAHGKILVSYIISGFIIELIHCPADSSVVCGCPSPLTDCVVQYCTTQSVRGEGHTFYADGKIL